MLELALLLANTDRLQQVEDYVRVCNTSTKWWPTSKRLRIMSEGALLLPNTDDFNKLKIISAVALLLANTDRPQQAEDYDRGCTISSKYWRTSTGWILCQKLHYFYQILTYLNSLKIMSEVVLLLANTDWPQLVEDYVRGCTTFSEYWPPSTSRRLCQMLHYL
jgi:hypothetical protein